MAEKVYEEDIEAAHKLAESIFGPNGTMLDAGKEVQFNATVETKEHGVLWYGDLDLGASSDHKFQSLQQHLGVNVYSGVVN